MEYPGPSMHSALFLILSVVKFYVERGKPVEPVGVKTKESVVGTFAV